MHYIYTQALTYQVPNQLGRPAWHRGFLDDDLISRSHLGNGPHGSLDIGQVRCYSLAGAVRLGRGIDAQDNDFSVADGILDIPRESQVRCAIGITHRGVSILPRLDRSLADARQDLFHARLIHGETVGIPGVDSLLVLIDHGDESIGALVGNHGAKRASWIIVAM